MDDLNCKDALGDNAPIRVISNSSEEGLRLALDGKVELHCKENSFENVDELQLYPNIMENPTDLLRCMTKSLILLSLSENFVGKLSTTALKQFINLSILDLKDTQLEKFDFKVLQNFNHSQENILTSLDISKNNLKSIDNLKILSSLHQLGDLNLGQNQLKNAYEIIPLLNSNLVDLQLHDNYLGHLNASTFDNLPKLKFLNVKNTTLSTDDVSLFDPLENLKWLDISWNNLENIDFSQSKISRRLTTLYANDCNIKKTGELLNSLGFLLVSLDLSGNFLNEINSSAFEKFSELTMLGLANMNLSYFDFNLLHRQKKLERINIAKNHLKVIDFTPFQGRYLEELYLEDNDLVDVISFTQSKFPFLKKISISKNQLPCEFLKKLDTQLRKWPELKLIGDLWDQKHGINCSIKNNNASFAAEKQTATESIDQTTVRSYTPSQTSGISVGAAESVDKQITSNPVNSEQTNEFTGETAESFDQTTSWADDGLPNPDVVPLPEAQISSNLSGNTTEKPITNNEPTFWMYITIGISLLNTIVIGTVCVHKKWSRRKIFNSDEPNIPFERVDEMRMPSISNELYEKSASVNEISVFSCPAEHIYEELPDRGECGDIYDHLQHDPRPIPISPDRTYDNFLILFQGHDNTDSTL